MEPNCKPMNEMKEALAILMVNQSISIKFLSPTFKLRKPQVATAISISGHLVVLVPCSVF